MHGGDMKNRELTIVARVRAKSGRENEVYRELSALVPLTRGEDGCICYLLHRSQDDPAQFCFYERWRSRSDLDEHLATPYLQAFLAKADDLLAEPVAIEAFELLQ